MTHSPKNPSKKQQSPDDKPLLSFDFASSLSDIEKHLEAARQSSAHERIETESPEILVDASHIEPTVPIVELSVAQPITIQSNFLAELAQEAALKQGASQTEAQALKARSQILNNAMARIDNFFCSLSQFANDMGPNISRPYSLDARTSFANLKWQFSRVESRKQDLTSTAMIAYVTIGVLYRAPESSILVTRPWQQLESLKSELNNLNLKVLDKSELDGKRPKQEWLKVRISPELPVYLRFQGNYETGYIDLYCRNLLAFGTSSYRLEAANVTTELLEDIGRILLGRSDKIPEVLTPTELGFLV